MNEREGIINPPDDRIREVLSSMRRIVVVGISPKEERASHGIARFLLGRGLEVLGVNPVLHEPVLGAPMFPTVRDVPGPIDLVDIFRRSESVPPIVDDAIAAGAGFIWMQEGISHPAAAAKAAAAGIDVIMERCIYKEWLRLMNG